MATTFILLADPQINKAPEPERYETCGNLNVALNNFKQNNAVYPSIKGINCAGQPIAPIAATFIAGDLTQFGGNLNRGEQADLTKGPATYVGGEFLRRLRALYCPGAGKTGSDKQVEKLIDTGPIYFGLGNHDLEGAAGEGPPGWRFSNGAYSTPNNHFRYQMWNFINQMHGSPKAPFKIPALYKGGWDETGRHLQMDCPLEGSYEWQKYSMNYVVNLGPVDVYQLHVFGGDSRHGRNDGLEWLKRTLAIKGYSRPVIIVQHDLPSETQDQWVDEEATVHETNHLMEVLLPYNVIAFLVGHNHDQGPCPRWLEFPNQMNTFPRDAPKKKCPEFRPGCAFDQHFGLFRITKQAGIDGMYDLNVLYGTAKNQAPFLVWNIGYTHTFSRKPTVWVAGISIVLTPDEKHTNPNVTHTVTELSGQSADINDGFGGSFVWVHPILTTDRSQAITGIKLHILKAEISGWGENVGQGRGSGGYNYRYLETVREEGKPPITGLSFLRSDKAASCPPHFKDYTGDINDKRGGSFLYLCWRTWDEWTLDD